jgi:hypothetical protein
MRGKCNKIQAYHMKSNHQQPSSGYHRDLQLLKEGVVSNNSKPQSLFG